MALALAAAAPSVGRAQFVAATTAADVGSSDNVPGVLWLDSFQLGLHRFVARTARWMDGLGGPRRNEDAYFQGASGSVTVAMLWDEYDGLDPKLRFRVDLPLPQINERIHAFVGRVDPDEFVSERDEPSGIFPRQRGVMDEDQTLAGLMYRGQPRNGGRFDAGAGVRLRSPLDPYVKTGYRYERPLFAGDGRLALRETAFWQHSEGAGFTSRVDVERFLNDYWHVRWTGSTTFSQESRGVRGFSTMTLTWLLADRRAMILRVGGDGETDAPVPLRSYGVKLAYRRSVLRDWLILEMCTSVSWTREHLDEAREPSWGLGVGFEMLFGDETFSALPVTF